MAAVINIVTRRGGARPSRSADVSGGRFATYRMSAGSRGPAGAARYAVSASIHDAGEPTPGSRLRARRAGFTLDAEVGPGAMLDVTARAVDWDSESFPDDSGGPTFAVLGDVDRREALDATLGVGLQFAPSAAWTLDLDASYFRHDDDVVSPGVAPGPRDPFGIPPNATDARFERVTASAVAGADVSNGLTLAFGADGIREDGDSEGTLDFGGFLAPTGFALRRDQWAVFAEADWAVAPGWSLQAGMRRDDAEGFDAAYSPRVALTHTIDATGTSLHVSWGKGFKLPSFFALGHPIVGNPGLSPERSESLEVGLGQPFLGGRGLIDLALFDTDYDNAIDFDPGPPPRLVNRARIEARGVEAAVQMTVTESVVVSANLTYLDAEVAETGAPPRSRPRWRAGGSVRWSPENDIELSLVATHVGSISDSSIPTGDVTLDPYTRMDLSARWFVTPSSELYVAVQNALDERYEEFVGFDAPGILPRIGARLTF
jgi:outer membrane cobalamin receptor